MPLSTFTIPVDKGAVNSRDPAFLERGELEIAENAEYRSNDIAIWSTLGQTAFNASATAAQVAGKFLQFDRAANRIIVSTGATWLQAEAGDAGSFTTLLTGLSPATLLDGILFGNKGVLWDGVNRARTVDKDLTLVLLGMKANTQSPIVDPDAGSGVGFTLSANNSIDYWIEERVKDADGIILKRNITVLGTSEFTTAAIGGLTVRNFLKRKLLLLRAVEEVFGTKEFNKEIAFLKKVVSEVVKPRIFRPPLVNSDTTHWAAYASATNGVFPIGSEIGEALAAVEFIDDPRTGSDPGLSGDIYETHAVNVVGLTTVVPKNGEPPIPDTGDIFDDCLVLNDIADRTSIAWSHPRSIHAFPPLNRAYIPSRPGEKVTFIRRLGVQLLVGTNESMWKFYWLPRPDESSFQRERGKEQIHGAQGVVGPQAGTIFSYGQGMRLAYVSFYGIHITNGVDWDDISDDLDFESLVERSLLHKSVLLDNPSKYRLEWYFAPKGQAAITKVMHFYYHPSHAKESRGGGFRAKITGPNDIEATSAFLVTVNNDKRVYTTTSEGVVYRQGVGALNGTFKVRTKAYEIAGQGDELVLRKVLMHHRKATQPIHAQVAYVLHNEDQDTTRSVAQLDFGSPRSTGAGLDGVCEEFQIEASTTNPPEQVCINQFAVQYEATQEAEK